MDDQLRQFLAGLVVGLDPVARFEHAIGPADDWQKEVLRTDPALNADDQFVTVLASRQTGKSTTIGSLAYDDVTRGKTCLLAAPSQRQSQELLRRITTFLQADPAPPKLIRSTLSEIETAGGGRVVSIPATDQARGFTADTIVLDEAAWLDDDAIAALLPMRRSGGRVLMMSTPRGRGGFFYDTWSAGKTRRIFARSVDIPRLADKVEYDRRFMSEIRFRAEHMCEFLGSGMPLISLDVLDNAISSEHALCLN
jgi:hypothetical protein